MSAAPAPDGPAPTGRPSLFAVLSCQHCGHQVTEVRDRTGKPVRLDGRDPAGEWWATKVGGRWRVVRPERGEDPPTSGNGVRYAEHQCPASVAETAVRTRFATVAVEQIEEVEPELDELGEVDPAAVRRPGKRGQGLTGNECPARRRLIQHPPEGGPPFSRMCIRCGRITSRTDGDSMAWCGGLLRVGGGPGAKDGVRIVSLPGNG